MRDEDSGGIRLFRDVALYGSAYLFVTGTMMLVNEAWLRRADVPWTWYWLLWGTMFSPAAITGMFMLAATSSSAVRRLWSSVGSLATIAVLMEALFVLDVHFASAAVGIAITCATTIAIFKSSEWHENRDGVGRAGMR